MKKQFGSQPDKQANAGAGTTANEQAETKSVGAAHRASPGTESVSQTPKDVATDQAAAKDVTKRNLDSKNPDERTEALIDDASELSFPASDPPAIASSTRIEKPQSGSDQSKSQPSQKPQPKR
ncbi:MAG: hypothetical protein ACTHKB_12770 [Burkholderiaceae bacterium]